MSNVTELELRRDAILQEMRTIRAMKRGTINEQFLKVYQRGLKSSVARGPYFVFSRYEAKAGKTKSRRLTSVEELEQMRRDIAAYQRWVALCREFEEMTERLGELERSVPEHEAKKNDADSDRAGS